MAFSLDLALGVHRVEIEPEVGGVRRLADLVVLIADAVNHNIEQLGVCERHIEVRLQHTERGQSHNPVIEDTVFDLVVFELGENIVERDVESLKEILLEDAPQFENRQKKMRVAVQHHFRQCLEFLFLFGRKRCLGVHEMYTARKYGFVLRLILSGKYNARSDRNSDGYSVLHLATRRATPKTFENVYALRHKVVGELVEDKNGISGMG